MSTIQASSDKTSTYWTIEKQKHQAFGLAQKNSLNRTLRKKQLEKISQENKKIFTRLGWIKRKESRLKSFSANSIYLTNLSNSYKIRRANSQKEIEKKNQGNLKRLNEIKTSMSKYRNPGAIQQAQRLSRNREAKIKANLNISQHGEKSQNISASRLQSSSSNSASGNSLAKVKSNQIQFKVRRK
jgi:hypothetical protein